MRKLASFRTRLLVAVVVVSAFTAFVFTVEANHSWGNYHWARSSNPFTLQLGDNVSTLWDSYLATASSDWSSSIVLDTFVVSGVTSPKSCKPVAGRVEVCNSKYGFNGWLGAATVWASGGHIVQGTVKVNDSYFSKAQYNTPAWRRLVMCQEIGHTFGLDHQDENPDNPNLGTCMDYTRDPDGPLSNEHPNQHDYDQLEAIYAHLDSSTSAKQSTSAFAGFRGDDDSTEPQEWGKVIRKSSDGKPSLYMRDLGAGHKIFTFVIWAD